MLQLAIAPARDSLQRTALLIAAIALAACSSNQPADSGVDVLGADATDVVAVDAPRPDTGNPAWSDDCDPLVEQQCAMPWPSNLYLVPDPARATGYTLTFGAHSLPSNTFHLPINPQPYTRLDGYGVGTPIMVIFPNVDISAMATEDHIERSLADDATVLLYEVSGTSLTRVPYFVELDSHEPHPSRQTLFVRPAVILHEATRYLVAFRALHDTMGAPIAASTAFAMLRDNTSAAVPSLARRQARFNEVFTLLASSGVMRTTLTLAWDFVTASASALTGTLLHVRDDALTATGGHGPAFTVTQVTQYQRSAPPPTDGGTDGATDATAPPDASALPVDDNIALEIHGTVSVPNYLEPMMIGANMGVRLHRGAGGVPAQMGMRDAAFWIRVPWSALARPAVPHRLMQYGHGLLGSGTEMRADYLGAMANQFHYVLFSADLTGMSYNDFPYVLAALEDASNFVSVADGLHQGLVEWVLIARAAKDHVQALPDIASRGIVIDTSEMYYSGNSQGGIFGGTYVAMSPDIRRGHLGVPGSNYATLLARSHDFTMFFGMLRSYYPNIEDEALAISALQLLWDGTDPVSYYRHLSAVPFDANFPHAVVMTPAKGDHQVAVITNEITARSNLGIALMANYDNQRMPYGITPAAFPRIGSGIVLYDFGNPWPPIGNQPPAPPDTLPDPHELPRRASEEQSQVDHFFRTGEIIDTCMARGCHYRCDTSGCTLITM